MVAIFIDWERIKIKGVYRKAFTAFAAVSLLITGSQGVLAATVAKPPVSIVLDGYPLRFPIEPISINGTNMVPFRAIAEALRISVVWDSAKKTITATKTLQGKAKTVVLQLNKKQARVNGAPVELLAAPVNKGGNTLVPLAFFSAQFGAGVAWNGLTRTVTIQSPVEDIYTMAYYAMSSFKERGYIHALDAVSFGWSRINQDGELILDGKDFYWPQAAGAITPENIVAEAASDGKTPYFMVFGTDGTGEVTKLLSDPNLSAKAVDSIVQTASDKGFKGVAIDFEGLGLTGDRKLAQQQFTAFIQKLYAKTKPLGLKISLALHPLNGAYHGYDYKELAKLADELVIMAYHYESGESPEPMNRVDEGIRLALAQVKKEQLMLGISFGSENAQTVNDKIGLAKRYGLKGIALWRLGLIGDEAFQQMKRTIVLE
ncbi:stalk domain-containing protein [Paenibacillus aurantiacus]|uniref:Stalk domain-containing protein n=1 Tax=Paenibacillus aurantiacus TaxID=1936118 RepID=A0ABV5KQE4_9BACL